MKKLEFAGPGGTNSTVPPDYLQHMAKPDQLQRPVPTPVELYCDAVAYLEPSDCLPLIPAALIADYAMAKYHLINVQYELGRTATVTKIDKGLRKDGRPNEAYELTDFAEAMLKMQKNVLATWQPIWDIVSRNSERLLTNPEQDLMALLIAGRQRRKPKGDPPDGLFANPENPGD
jgi:hypothetical protein